MKTILITNQPDIAVDAEAAGVSRIMVDLESIGKKERQASRTTFISAHQKDDVEKVRKALKKAALIVRVNPWHKGSGAEIEHALQHGADIIMLPMISDVQQVRDCLSAIGGMAQCLPLIETSYSMRHIAEIADLPGIPELYIGLNDLHLSLGQDFLFEPLADGSVDRMADALKARGKPFGFGGIAKMGSGELPAQRILAEHERLGSSSVILSSRFCKDIMIEQKEGRVHRMTDALAEMQDRFNTYSQRSEGQRASDREETFAIIRRLAAEIKEKRQAI